MDEGLTIQSIYPLSEVSLPYNRNPHAHYKHAVQKRMPRTPLSHRLSSSHLATHAIGTRAVPGPCLDPCSKRSHLFAYTSHPSKSPTHVVLAP